MITLNNITNGNRAVLHIAGLSTDEKPIDEIEGAHITNGSIFRCVDTGDMFVFDYENKEWCLWTNQNNDISSLLVEIQKVGEKIGDLNASLETRLAGGVADE